MIRRKAGPRSTERVNTFRRQAGPRSTERVNTWSWLGPARLSGSTPRSCWIPFGFLSDSYWIPIGFLLDSYRIPIGFLLDSYWIPAAKTRGQAILLKERKCNQARLSTRWITFVFLSEVFCLHDLRILRFLVIVGSAGALAPLSRQHS